MTDRGHMTLPGGTILGWRPLDGRTGHEAAWELLEELYCAPLPEVRRTDRGKPYFACGAPYFSISHTKRHAFCAMGPAPLGLDAEEADRKIRPALAEKILSPGEAARLQAAEDPRAALLKLWVLKEAEAKRTGEGLRGYPNKTDFSPDDPRVLTIAGCYVAVLTEGD